MTHPLAIQILAEIPPEIGTAIREAIDLAPDDEPDEIANRVVAKLSEPERWAIARDAVAHGVAQVKRSRVRQAEKLARRSMRPRSTPAHSGPSADELRDKLSATLAAWAEGMKLDLTRELLSSTFALGDGTSVSWGEASVDDHARRAEALERQGVGTLETAAMHHAAVRELHESGKANLDALSRSRKRRAA